MPLGGTALCYNGAMHGTRCARWIVACCLACVISLSPRLADARGGLKEAIIAIFVGVPAVVFGVTDLGLLIYDITKAAQHQRPSNDVAVAEVVLASVQLGFGALLLKSEHDEPLILPLVIPDMVLSTGMLIHGSWALATREDGVTVMSIQARNLDPAAPRPQPALQPRLSLRPQGLPRGAGLLLQGSF